MTFRIASAAAVLFLLCQGASGCRKAKGSPKQSVAAPSASAAPAPTARSAAKACSPACNSIEHCDSGRCVPHCPEGEVYIPATGPDGFMMGRGKPGEFDQKHKVVLTHPLCMDQTEVTVAAYRRCVEAGHCTIPQLRDINSNYRPAYHRDKHPVNMVNWMQATAYCKSRGQALPTEAQFEWASGHGDGRTWPWGNKPAPTCDNHFADFTPGGAPKSDPAGDVGCYGGDTSPVKSLKGIDRWPDGDLYEIGGNVWEWTADCYVAYPSTPQVDPSPQSHPRLHGDCYVRSLRGGGWNRSDHSMHPWVRAASKRTYRVGGLGFRCVRDPT